MSDDFFRALFVVLAMTPAGVAHVLWLRSPMARRFARPVDGGRRWRGKPVFGANKTWAGFMALPPAGACSMALAYFALTHQAPELAARLWPLTDAQTFGLGALLGVAFMAFELPNSFVKRQLDVAPGRAASQPWVAPLFALIDRLDSPLGVLAALASTVGLTPALAGWFLAWAVFVHAALSVLMYALGLKARAL